jgi:peroxiredoxin
VRDLNKIPEGLPVPVDDGACSHLMGSAFPDIKLLSTAGRSIHLNEMNHPTVIFFYPRTGEPSKPAPPDWDLIPGARGCTPQSCGFRDLYKEFQALRFQVFGASTQDPEYQKEFVHRNHVPFEILSDSKFDLTNAMNLPTFNYNGMRLIKRMAWIVEGGKISKVFYPVFPPNENAATVLSWLRSRP